MKIFKWLLLGFLVLIIILRMLLPGWVKQYVENTINAIPEYRVKIADVDISLLAGNYTIKNIQLWKVTKKIPVPFFEAESVNFSVQWKALLHGKLVAKMIVIAPTVNFVMDPKGNNDQLTIDDQWVNIVKSLYPLNINKITIHNGKATLRSYTAKPPFNLYLKNTEVEIENMQNADRVNKTNSSYFKASANTMDGANIISEGNFDPFSKQPTFYLTLSLKGMNVKAANPFLKHFTNVKVDKGTFSLYIEVAAANGKITGYAKPFLKNLKVNNSDAHNPIEAIYQGAVTLLSKVVENSKKKTIATKIKISGDIEDPDTSILSIIGYVLRHAFIEALVPQVDHNIEMRDVRVAYPKRKIKAQ